MELKSLRTNLERKKGEQSAVQRQVAEIKERVEHFGKEVDWSEQAQIIIQTVAKETQQQLEYRISELVSLAQASVFDSPWNLKLDFVLRRGRTECDLLWEKTDGRQSKDITYGGGGGESDTGALGLQFSMWSLQRPRTRNFMTLDEPLKHLKGGEFPERGALMIKEISKGINLQILMISHIPEQVAGADSILEVIKKKIGKDEISQVIRRK